MPPKGHAPVHQNRFKFKHNKNSKKTIKILGSPISPLLCHKCRIQLEWKKDYRKYKPLTTPRRCNTCTEKRIKCAYHIMCDRCSKDRKECPKCRDHFEAKVEEEVEIDEDEQQLVSKIAGMSIRKRKALLRQLEKEDTNKAERLSKVKRTKTDEDEDGEDLESCDDEQDESGEDDDDAIDSDEEEAPVAKKPATKQPETKVDQAKSQQQQPAKAIQPAPAQPATTTTKAAAKKQENVIDSEGDDDALESGEEDDGDEDFVDDDSEDPEQDDKSDFFMQQVKKAQDKMQKLKQ